MHTYISFNIRSIREFSAVGAATLATLIEKQGFKGEAGRPLIEKWAPTVIFLQETHLAPEDVATTPVSEWLKPLGWKIAAANSLNRRSSGILALTAATMAATERFTTEFGPAYPLFVGRVIEYSVGSHVVMNVYGMHSGMKLEKLATRTGEWDVQLRNRIAEHRAAGKKVIVFGDLNVAPEAIDLANPTANKRRAGFTKEERESWKITQTATMLIDAYRLHHAGETGRYSFWTSRVPTARVNNVGWRLDTAWCSEDMKSHIVACDILAEIGGSDHAPLLIITK